MSIGAWSHMLITAGPFREEQYEEKLLKTMTSFCEQTRNCGIVAAGRLTFAGRVDFNGQEDIGSGSQKEGTLKKANGLNRKLMIVILTPLSTLIYNQVKHAGYVKLSVHAICMQ